MACRGCERYEQEKDGQGFYQFDAQGWDPEHSVFDNSKLVAVLMLGPRETKWDTWRNPNFQGMVKSHEIFEEHIDHVSDDPIFIGEFTFKEPSTGKVELFHLCTDGHHRMAKRIKQQRDIDFYLFTEAEMRFARYPSLAAYMRSKGVFILGATDEEIEKALWDA